MRAVSHTPHLGRDLRSLVFTSKLPAFTGQLFVSRNQGYDRSGVWPRDDPNHDRMQVLLLFLHPLTQPNRLTRAGNTTRIRLLFGERSSRSTGSWRFLFTFLLSWHFQPHAILPDHKICTFSLGLFMLISNRYRMGFFVLSRVTGHESTQSM
jgi:hypothetical protein